VKICPPTPAHELGSITIDNLLSPNTKRWNPPQKTIAPQIDYLKLAMWIGVLKLAAFAAFAALMVSL
jgi:hypothetical protein